MKPLRVAHAIYSHAVGGSEMCAAQICANLDPDKFKPSVVFIYPHHGPMPEILEAQNIPSYDLGRRRLNRFVWPFLAGTTLRKQKIDIVHVHHLAFLPIMAAAARFAGIRHIVFTEHSIFGHEHKKRLQRIMPRIPDMAHVTTVVSEGIRRFLVDKGNLDPEGISVIPNGVDTRRFVPRSTGGVLRSLVEATDGEHVFVAVGRLTDAKNYPLLIDAVDLLRKSGIRLKVGIIGDGEMRKSLGERIRDRKMENTVYLLGGRTDVHEILPEADGYLLTSKHEGLPIAVLEAMSCGLPVLATAVGGLGEVIKNGENGLLTPSGDPRKFAENVGNLLESPQRACALGAKARQTVVLKYSWDRLSRRYEEVYARLRN